MSDVAVEPILLGVRPGNDRRTPWWGIVGAFLRRDTAISLSYRVPFFMGVVQSTLNLGFLFFLSRLVGPRIAVTATHGSYFDFAVVGSTLLILFNTTLVSMAQRLRTDQSTGTLEVLLTMPSRPAMVVLGSAAYQVLYSTVTAAVTLAVAFGFGLRFHASAAGAVVGIASLVCSMALFMAVGVAFAAYVLVFKRGDALAGLAMAGLTVVGGVYYPLALLPHVLRVLADVVPFTWVVAVVRESLLQGEVPVGRLGELAVSAVVALPVAMALFSAALRHAQRRGSLGQY